MHYIPPVRVHYGKYCTRGVSRGKYSTRREKSWFIVVALQLEMHFLADQPLQFPVSTDFNLYKLVLRLRARLKESTAIAENSEI